MFNTQTPFSFKYNEVCSSQLLTQWTKRVEGNATTWTAPADGLAITCSKQTFDDFNATEWILSFENTGCVPTGILSHVLAMDLFLEKPLPDGTFMLHRTGGAPANQTDYEVQEIALEQGREHVLSAAGGRSSNKDLPFFRIDAGGLVAIVAVGWSGQWKAVLRHEPGGRLRLMAGLEKTNFRLLSGERLRGPRMLVMLHSGDPEMSHSVFRQLLLKHYIPQAHGNRSVTRTDQGRPAPVLFCNTCFTREGAWLNECNEANQISLINALAPFGAQAVVTDAGWFKGGWPNGAGNWDYDPQKYPRGFGPVAEAASKNGMRYGLWFEPERVVKDSQIDREHDRLVLRLKASSGTGLLDFGLSEARELFLGIVNSYLKLPGLEMYRQDFNMDPLEYWRQNDAPDRVGVTEMKYIAGLYEFWDALRAAHPDILMEECASGGRRTDLETLVRFQIHQKSDYWFDNLVDQATLYALSQYLPNLAVSVPLNRLDEYSFHSTLASSLILGWIADDSRFDKIQAARLAAVYRRVRHLLNGDWHGLTPWSREAGRWLASQYHRPDLGEGMLLAFRRDKCEPSLVVRLRGLSCKAQYELDSTVTGRKWQCAGVQLAEGFKIAIPKAPGSDLIVYRQKP